ncbi:MAG: ABC transporter permease subunit [Dysgonamonadaceae bacterium]|nr:ABC transporter permease subunit [Dysgonamonadaceae bacterium]
MFRLALILAASAILLLAAGMLYTLIIQSLPAFEHWEVFSPSGFSGWDSGEDQGKHEARSIVAGTFATAILALLVSIPFALSLALFCSVYRKNTKTARRVSTFVDLCARIPSIILGVWGYFSLRPVLLSLHTGIYASGILTTALVLAIMIIPYLASFGACLFDQVPGNLKEGAYSLGATHTEVIRTVCFPFARKGLVVAVFLAFGKVLGETMIVCLLAGNTIPSVLVGRLETAGELSRSGLCALALLLFLTTAVIHSVTVHLRKQTG